MRRRSPRQLFFVAATVCLSSGATATAGDGEPWITYPGGDGPGQGKHVVLVSGDEEYRSEEALPQLGKILSVHHGFKCTVLFAIHPNGNYIDPNVTNNIPGLEALEDADLMIMALRFRDLPDDQMVHIDNYLKAGKPVIGMRTSTHAFKIDKSKTYEHYSVGYAGDEKGWAGGFGNTVLGETWVGHHGIHGGEGTLGLITEAQKRHPILTGINDGDIFGDTDVYAVNLPLPGDSTPLVLGQVIRGLKPGGAASERIDKRSGNPVNDPMMPIAWTKTYQLPDSDNRGFVFTTTMGSSTDLQYVGTRRMIVNAAYHLSGMDVPKDGANVDLVGNYEPTKYAFRQGKRFETYWKDRDLRPSDFEIED